DRVCDAGLVGHKLLVADKFEISLIGLHRSVLVAAVEPFGHLTGYKHGSLRPQVLERGGKLKFAFFADVVVYQMLHLARESLTIFKEIDSDDGEVGNKIGGLLNKSGNLAAVVQFHDTELAGVVHALNPD